MAISEAADRTAEGRQVLLDLPLVSLLEPAVRELVVEAFVPMQFAFGQSIIRQGDPPDGMYLLVSGLARAVQTQEDGDEVALGVLRPGDSFGEAALLTGEHRSATVRASSDVTVFRLEPAVFQALLRVYPDVGRALELQARARHLENFMRLHSAFSHLPRTAIASMLDECQELAFDAGTPVVREGDPPGPMFIVMYGRLVAYKGDAHRIAGYLRTGDFFGELSLYRRAPRAATVEAVTPVRVLGLGEATFRRLMADHSEFRSRIEEQVAAHERASGASVPLDFAEELLPAGTRELALAAAPVEEGGAAEPATPESVAVFDVEEDGGDGTAARPRQSDRLIRRASFPLVRQLDEMDCGVACVAMVCRHFGRPVALSHIRLAVGTSVDGTSLRGIQRGGEFVGLKVRAVRASKDRLDNLPLPAIVHLDQNHWAVLHRVDPTRVHLADPARGHRRLGREEFLKRWSGYAALTRPTKQLAEAPLAPQGHARWLWPFVRPHLAALLVALLLTLEVRGFRC